MPVIVRDMSDEEAVIRMVDSNLQREHILPSERAFAYKMKLEAIKNQGARSDLTSGQFGPKLRSDEQVAQDAGESRKQVQRYVRLTNLIPELLDLVDQKKISFNPAVELSYLTASEQRDFLEAMQDTQNVPSLSQTQRIKKLSQEGKCSYEAVFDIMGEEKKVEMDRVTIKNEVLRKYFPKSYTPKQMQDTIIKLLEQEQEANQKRLHDLAVMQSRADAQESEVRTFIKEIRRYAAIEELDESVLNRLISKILIGEVKKVDGQKVQEVRIVYNFVGEIPEIAA